MPVNIAHKEHCGDGAALGKRLDPFQDRSVERLVRIVPRLPEPVVQLHVQQIKRPVRVSAVFGDAKVGSCLFPIDRAGAAVQIRASQKKGILLCIAFGKGAVLLRRKQLPHFQIVRFGKFVPESYGRFSAVRLLLGGMKDRKQVLLELRVALPEIPKETVIPLQDHVQIVGDLRLLEPDRQDALVDALGVFDLVQHPLAAGGSAGDQHDEVCGAFDRFDDRFAEFVTADKRFVIPHVKLRLRGDHGDDPFTIPLILMRIADENTCLLFHRILPKRG